MVWCGVLYTISASHSSLESCPVHKLTYDPAALTHSAHQAWAASYSRVVCLARWPCRARWATAASRTPTLSAPTPPCARSISAPTIASSVRQWCRTWRVYKCALSCALLRFVQSVPACVLASLTLTAVVACDGLWDKITYAEAVQMVGEQRRAGLNATAIADFLTREALRRQSLDNVSAIVVFFQWE